MSPDLWGMLFDFGVPFAAGVWATWVGYRPPERAPADLAWADWDRRFGPVLRIAGPTLIVCSIALLAIG